MRTAARVTVLSLLTAVGTLLAAGCALAALFELQGFGTPRDAEPRAWYLALLALAAGTCVLVPLALWRRLLPRSAPAWVLVFAAATVGAALVLGLRG